MRHVLATAAAILRDPKPAHLPARTQVPFPPAWPRDRVIPLADVEYASEAERECVLAGRNPMGSVWTEKSTSSDLDAVNAAVASTLCAPGGALAVMGPEAARYAVDPVLNAKVTLTREFWLSLPVDAVTVSANEALQGGGGQDRVLHALAGPSLRAETATFPDTGRGFGDFKERCPTGDAVISHGHNLRQPWIVHLVAPYLDEEGEVQTQLYMRTLRAVLACIDGVRIRTMGLAMFGTGFYGCPQALAAVMTLRVLRDWLQDPANALKCDAVYIVSPFGAEEVAAAVLSLTFPEHAQAVCV